MRRLPVYLLLDTSGSMRGEPIQSVKVGLESMISSLRQDPFALESVHLSIITFDREVKVLVPLTELEVFQLPDIQTPDSGPTHLGEALELLIKRVNTEVIRSTPDRKGDWMPLLFIMTDGSPSDLMVYREAVPKVAKLNFGNIVACAAGPKAKPEFLKELTDNIVSLDTTDATTFGSFFKWVSASVSAGNKSMGSSAEASLPPPPPEVNVVL
ncbi:MAG: VWA domain-containing protein [Bacteroidia bacterium]